MSLTAMGQAARAAAFDLAVTSTALKNQALLAMADELESQQAAILQANSLDITAARDSGMSEALLDRLLLNPARLAGIVADVRKVVTLDDPVGCELESRVLDNGMRLELGRERGPAPASQRLQRFVDIYPVAVAGREPRPATVDLRYPNGFALYPAGTLKENRGKE